MVIVARKAFGVETGEQVDLVGSLVLRVEVLVPCRATGGGHSLTCFVRRGQYLVIQEVGRFRRRCGC